MKKRCLLALIIPLTLLAADTPETKPVGDPVKTDARGIAAEKNPMVTHLIWLADQFRYAKQPDAECLCVFAAMVNSDGKYDASERLNSLPKKPLIQVARDSKPIFEAKAVELRREGKADEAELCMHLANFENRLNASIAESSKRKEEIVARQSSKPTVRVPQSETMSAKLEPIDSLPVVTPPPLLSSHGWYLREKIRESDTYLILNSGHIFKVAPLDRLNCSLWLRTSSISIYRGDSVLWPYVLINEDEKGEDRIVNAKLIGCDK